MSNKKLQVWVPLLFSVAMIIGMFFGYRLRDNMPSGRGIFRIAKSSPLEEVMQLVRNRYVDAVSLDSLGDEAIEEILSRLDPHSVFIPARQLQDVNEDLVGRFEGIGVEFNIFNDTVHVLNVLKDGPSDKAGVKVGDRFIRVGDSIVAGVGISSERIRRLLRGPGGTKVTVNALRGAEQKQYTITRGFIPLYALDAGYIIEPATGYIRLNKFSETTYEEFMQALERLQKEGMQKLILDLRDNGGGILDEAVQIADEFLGGDTLVVYTEGVHSPRKEYRCRRKGLFEKGKLVLLLDESSASASEVLAGALQDYGRATIIGRRSFGKGLVQEQYNLSDGSALRLTTARYYTPLGRSIQKPYDKGVDEYNEEILNRYHHGGLLNADSNKSANGKVYVTKNGKPVYGGGGITPDIFVAIDTSFALDTSVTQLYRRNTMNNFVYRYYVANLGYFSQFKTPADFSKRFTADDKLIAELIQFAAKDSVPLQGIKERDKILLQKRLKNLLARQMWRNEGFYETANTDDLVVKKALEEIRK
jgi:carboxyl-terminal processing protease